MEETAASKKWRSRIKRRRGKTFHPGSIRELNLVAMMDMLTVVVVFLLKSYSVSALDIPVGQEIRVPTSVSIANPEEAVKLILTRSGPDASGVISVDSEGIYELSPAQLQRFEKMAAQRQYLLPELHRALSERAERARVVAQVAKDVPFSGNILVIADKETPYWLITQALFTSAQAGFDQYNLVAMREE